jgi:quinol monooxygenase YgiN
MRSVTPLLSLAMAFIGAMPMAHAQDAAAAYVVSYIEIAPAAKDQAAAVLRQLAAASRKDEGSVRFDVLQRIDRPHHFAIVEAWRDQKALEAHGAAAHTKDIRAKLQPLAAAPYDERPHGGLAVAAAGSSGAGGGAVYAVTHVDFIPPKKDEGIAALKELVEPSRRDAGNLRFDLLQQASRPNHLTLVEAWQDLPALDAHAVAPHTKAFRDKALPMSGSLFDERLYRALD